MKRIKALLSILVLTTVISGVGTSSSQAQENSGEMTVNLMEVTCRELFKASAEDKDLILVFYHGLVTAKKNQMVIDRTQLEQATDKITDYCIDNPKATLMTVFEKYR
ncbi:hypothetical protein PCC8801_0830 [Rippkaea orientalis PCC 8801]|uniref:Uncharacterized protein n=1 Tax=Rippkaea orientalis (strain PCC 8801 / RF-1) TaxID=41431 RepID=B7JYP2_RIPO1|nr:HdeA family protein [Rippkaea orientalis]ACK64912.1 hypothetical protein PCC8801_0830 [Rippkaea orientalis PCC 8801]